MLLLFLRATLCTSPASVAANRRPMTSTQRLKARQNRRWTTSDRSWPPPAYSTRTQCSPTFTSSIRPDLKGGVYGMLNSVYKDSFALGSAPSRASFCVSKLPGTISVEITFIATSDRKNKAGSGRRLRCDYRQERHTRLCGFEIVPISSGPTPNIWIQTLKRKTYTAQGRKCGNRSRISQEA